MEVLGQRMVSVCVCVLSHVRRVPVFARASTFLIKDSLEAFRDDRWAMLSHVHTGEDFDLELKSDGGHQYP